MLRSQKANELNSMNKQLRIRLNTLTTVGNLEFDSTTVSNLEFDLITVGNLELDSMIKHLQTLHLQFESLKLQN